MQRGQGGITDTGRVPVAPTTRLASRVPATRVSTIRELLSSGERSYSFEFFPPKTDEGERLLWQALRELEPLHPTFVSVTYGSRVDPPDP